MLPQNGSYFWIIQQIIKVDWGLSKDRRREVSCLEIDIKDAEGTDFISVDL